jgi:anti-anti-sigma factor
MAVEVLLESEKQVLTITISGRFDFSVHQTFRKAIEQANDKLSQIVVDMADTDYIDSSALGMLLVLRDKVNENKELISIRHAKPDVRKILGIANFDKLFTLHDD